jgi:putative phage-type endonuclease
MERQVFKIEDEKSWLEKRKEDLTSTDIASLFGVSPYVTYFDLWHRKKTGDAPSMSDNDRLMSGRFLEPAIAAMGAKKMGLEIEPFKDYIRIPQKRLASSFDFKTSDNAILEIKNVDYWAYKKGWIVEGADLDAEEAPVHIELQVQHQLFISGFEKAYIVALIGGNRIQILERCRNERIIVEIQKKAEYFWESIENNQPPSPSFPRDSELVTSLFLHSKKGKIVEATDDEDLNALSNRYLSSLALKTAMEEEVKSLKAQILMKIGDSEKTMLKDFVIKATSVSGNPGSLITAEMAQKMIGTVTGARSGYRRFQIAPI